MRAKMWSSQTNRPILDNMKRNLFFCRQIDKFLKNDVKKCRGEVWPPTNLKSQIYRCKKVLTKATQVMKRSNLLASRKRKEVKIYAYLMKNLTVILKNSLIISLILAVKMEMKKKKNRIMTRTTHLKKPKKSVE